MPFSISLVFDLMMKLLMQRQKVESSDENFQNYLSGISFDNQYFQTLSMSDYMGTEDEVEFTNNILEDYNFIEVTERMDELLVVLGVGGNMFFACNDVRDHAYFVHDFFKSY